MARTEIQKWLSSHTLFRVTISLSVFITLYLVLLPPSRYYSVCCHQNTMALQEGDAASTLTKVVPSQNVLKPMNQGKTKGPQDYVPKSPHANSLLNSATANRNADSEENTLRYHLTADHSLTEVTHALTISKSSLEPMAMALDYWEQMANAMNNFFELQCWARTVGITKVMEPSVVTSGGRAFGFTSETKRSLTFRDLFNIDVWNSMSVNHSFSSLVSPQMFLDNAVKEMVYVQLIYTRYGGRCQSMDEIMKKEWYKVLNSKEFRIVEKVCIDFRKEPNHNTMTQEVFRDRIFGKTGGKVTVVFDSWHGIRDYNDVVVRRQCTFRLPIIGTHCSGVMYKMADVETVSSQPASVKYAHNDRPTPLIPSIRMSSYLKRFKTEFMSGADYVAVMMRTEKIESKFLSEQPSGDNPCMTSIVSDWKKMTGESTNNSTTLFFSDIGGGHGSSTWGNHAARLFSDKVQNSLRVEHTLTDVNHFLETIMGSQNSVLIAALHREIIAQAKCVIVVGGGIFQRQTLNMFAHYHKGGELCYSFRNSSCVPDYIDFVYDNSYYDSNMHKLQN